MKKFISILSLVLTISIAFAQKADDLIKFKDTAFAFGKVKQSTPVTHEFSFINKGKKPLIIEDATAECGCTKPEFPKQPIMPGKSGKIKVTYDAKEAGVFTKKVTVKLVNIPETKILTITGEVVAAK